ncbi:MAG: hypothetical protein WAN65_15920, partial [Candidatus Sulfotelmatobacter sp.]
FLKSLASTKPAFATFFTNHVASSMHRYWAAAFPGDYEKFDFAPEWVETYSHEIAWTMQKADDFLARLARFADHNPEYQIWICTSMGQAPTTASPIETQVYITDIERFTRTFGLEFADWEQMPAMLPRYSFRVKPHKATRFREALGRFLVDNRPVRVDEAENGFFMIFLGHYNLKNTTVVLGDRVLAFEQMGLANVNIEDLSGTTAYHIPQGCLFIYDPADLASKECRTELSTLDIAPAVLKNFAVAPPAYMQPARLFA